MLSGLGDTSNVENWLIIDYDDTFLPSTSGFTKSPKSGGVTMLMRDDITLDQFIAIEQTANDIKAVISSFNDLPKSRVIVLTAAEEAWVKLSSHLFFFDMTSILYSKSVTVISARDHFASQYPTETVKWKRLVFDALVKECWSKTTPKMIVQLSDAEPDHKSLLHALRAHTTQDVWNTTRVLGCVFFTGASLEQWTKQWQLLPKMWEPCSLLIEDGLQIFLPNQGAYRVYLFDPLIDGFKKILHFSIVAPIAKYRGVTTWNASRKTDESSVKEAKLNPPSEERSKLDQTPLVIDVEGRIEKLSLSEYATITPSGIHVIVRNDNIQDLPGLQRATSVEHRYTVS